jgi:hypothetical protein
MVIPATHLRCAAAGAIGFALTTTHPLGIASTVIMPALALAQPTRQTSYRAALSYYGAALWPIIPGAKNFFGPDVSVLAALVLWVSAAAILAAVWPLVWSADRRQAIWRSPVALLLTVVPPLGVIGFASPLTAAGFLFPRTAWCGLLACAVLSGALAVWPRTAALAIWFFAVGANALHFNDPEPVPGWQGVNTTFGAIAHGRVHPVTEYQAAQWIQQYALSASAKVIVFPETVVSTWTAGTKRSGNKRSIAYARAEKRSSSVPAFRSAGTSLCSRIRTTSRQNSPLSTVDAQVLSRADGFSSQMPRSHTTTP